MALKNSIIPEERIEKVMLDEDLAKLYGVETKVLLRAVKRNKSRFPRDFMLHLTPSELENLRCQIGTSSWGGRRYLPYAFTEHGVAMLSSILRSKRAIQVNIAIMRAFVRLRKILASHKDLARKFDELDRKVAGHGEDIRALVTAIRKLMETPSKSQKNRIGFHP